MYQISRIWSHSIFRVYLISPDWPRFAKFTKICTRKNWYALGLRNVFAWSVALFKILLQNLIDRQCRGVYNNHGRKYIQKYSKVYSTQSMSYERPCFLRPVTLLKKRLYHRYVPLNFAKFLRTPFLQSTSGRLLLDLLNQIVRTDNKFYSVKSRSKTWSNTCLKMKNVGKILEESLCKRSFLVKLQASNFIKKSNSCMNNSETFSRYI